MTFKELFLSSLIFFKQDRMSERDRIVVFVYVNSLFKLISGMLVDAGSRGFSKIDNQNKRFFLQGGRAVEQ